MKMMLKIYQLKVQIVIKKKLTILFILFSGILFGQKSDSLFIIFNKKYPEMIKSDYTHLVQNRNSNEKLGKSITFYIKQKEKETWSDNEFSFSHTHRDKKTYEIFGGRPSVVLKKNKSYLHGKHVLDINFFRTTPYKQICKTFEEEDSHEQDVVIFMIDEDEIKNDTITIREVKFSRPLKQ